MEIHQCRSVFKRQASVEFLSGFVTRVQVVVGKRQVMTATGTNSIFVLQQQGITTVTKRWVQEVD
ncbi:hypothetical protein COLO4_01568 [Corchorus olitorius]|uniref:Uncharacterized protein n=1 Tax=Corchorus olitorius TaxID=93759 RepID=A0A1R3L2C6_9ROSI|nr:hypothetical protein COLO4_01568 [Corchorus olitorius]